MRHVKYFGIPLVLVAVIALSTLFVSGIACADSPEITSVNVYSSFIVTDDWLVVIAYNCSVVPYYPSYNPANYWSVELLNAAGTVVATNPMKAWGMRPQGLYLGPVATSALEWGNANYSVRIVQNSNTSINASSYITGSNWVGNSMASLDGWCIYQAKTMAIYDGVTDGYTITTSEHGDVLNLLGGPIFDTGIYQLSVIRPDLFYITVSPVGNLSTNTYTGALQSSLADWETAVGPVVAAIFNDAGAIVHLSGRWVGGFFVLCLFMVVAGFSVSLGHFGAGAALGVLVVIGGMLAGLIPVALLLVMIGVGIVLAIKERILDKGA